MKIFEAYELGRKTLKNRVVMAPMTRNRADESGVLPDYAAEYYRQRAGAGLIISEATQPCAGGKGYRGTPGMHSDDQQSVWSRIAGAVHEDGGSIYCQLMHTGRIGHTSFFPKSWTLIAPSAIPAQINVDDAEGNEVPAEIPVAASKEQIQEIIDDFASAAERAIAAGLDGVEVHGANGYLLHQFLSHGTNLRTDEYGGSPARRARFVVDLVTEMARRIGPEKIGLRLSPGGQFNDMQKLDDDETYLHLVNELQPVGIAYLHVLRRRSTPLHLKLHEAWGTGFMLNTGYLGSSELVDLNALVESDEADLISVGRNFISNPDLVSRWKSGASLSPWNEETFYVGEEKGLIDYPAAKKM
jgi:N-ethylmaleimide reductase